MATKIRMVELFEAGKVIRTDDSYARPDLAPILVDELVIDLKSNHLIIVANKSGSERKYIYNGSYLIHE